MGLILRQLGECNGVDFVLNIFTQYRSSASLSAKNKQEKDLTYILRIWNLFASALISNESLLIGYAQLRGELLQKFLVCCSYTIKGSITSSIHRKPLASFPKDTCLFLPLNINKHEKKNVPRYTQRRR